MKIKEIWNKADFSQRSQLLRALYGNNFFEYLCGEDYDNLIYGVKRRLDRLEQTINALNVQSGTLPNFV